MGMSDHEQTDRARRDSEARIRGILATAVDGIITIDERSIVESLNPASEKIFGYTTEEMIGQNVKMLMPPPYRDEHEHYIHHYLRTGQRKIIGIGREVVGQRKDGSLFPMEIAVSEIRLFDRVLFTGVVRDISKRRALEKEVSEISTREQQRIGRDLHDGLGQELTGIAFLANTLRGRLAARSLPEAHDAADITELANASIEHARALVRGLCPVELQADGLMRSLRELAATVEAVHDVECSFACEQPVFVSEPGTAMHLYYIAHEAVNNIVKHAQARKIIIALGFRQKRLTLQISDNGIGLSRTPPDNAGRGVHLMHYRARVVGGSLDVRDRTPKGTIVICSVDHRSNPSLGASMGTQTGPMLPTEDEDAVDVP